MRLIDADALAEKIECPGEPLVYWDDIEAAPTVDAVILPCKIGDPVFIIGSKYRAGRFEQWINTGAFRLSDLEKVDKTVFLAREEAEAALARMKG